MLSTPLHDQQLPCGEDKRTTSYCIIACVSPKWYFSRIYDDASTIHFGAVLNITIFVVLPKETGKDDRHGKRYPRFTEEFGSVVFSVVMAVKWL